MNESTYEMYLTDFLYLSYGVFGSDLAPFCKSFIYSTYLEIYLKRIWSPRNIIFSNILQSNRSLSTILFFYA